MNAHYVITVEDFTKSFTSSFKFGCANTRFVDVTIHAENDIDAKRQAIDAVSVINGTPKEFLCIAD